MKVLIACEFSGIVRDSFIERGHDAVSCDFLETEKPGPHRQQDVLTLLDEGWDLMIAHPPCTHLAVSGARWFKEKLLEQEEALKFVCDLMNAPIEKKCVENPVSVISSRIMKPTQSIQPWQFGDPEQKKTCLWLFNLPPLIATHGWRDYPEIKQSVHKMPPGPERWRERSRTFPGIARAMAAQWG